MLIRRERRMYWCACLAAALGYLGAAICAEAGAQGADPSGSSGAATACARTVEQFVTELDSVMAENPTSITSYNAVLAKYLFLKTGGRGMPPPAPGASIEGCNIADTIATAKRSKFIY